jgi:hypothetical protein
LELSAPRLSRRYSSVIDLRFGKGNYSYITREREWQQTTGFFGKLANSHTKVIQALNREGITKFPAVPTLGLVNRFEYFRRAPDREAGVWLCDKVTYGSLCQLQLVPSQVCQTIFLFHMACRDFAAPVEQTFPILVPFVELSDGRKVVATDGADSIQPSSDGKSLRAHWTHWALVGGKSGDWIDVGLTSDVVWRIDNNTFSREEILSSDRPVNIRRWQMAVPSSYGQLETELKGQTRIDRFSSRAGTLSAQLSDATFSFTTSVLASGTRRSDVECTARYRCT